MEDPPYDPGQCLTFWFRLVQSHRLQLPVTAGVRVERVDALPRQDGGTLTFPQELRWPMSSVVEDKTLFQVKAAVPVPIISHDQVLFLTLRDVLDRVVARVHVTYTDARLLQSNGFSQWYPAEPAPLTNDRTREDGHGVTYDQLARNESTTFRLVRFLENGNLYALPLNAVSISHPSTNLMSDSVDTECFRWAADVAPDTPERLLLAGAFRLPVQAILFDIDETATDDATSPTKRHVHDGKYLADILLGATRCTEEDKLFVACEYASGNMCAVEVPSLADDDDYTRLAFPDGSDAVHRTAIDKTGARVAVLRRLNLRGSHPAIVMTLSSGRPFIEAGLAVLPATVVILSERQCDDVLMVAWKVPVDASKVEIYTRWRARWKRHKMSTHSQIWTLHASSLKRSPHVYLCDEKRWSSVYLPSLLATTPRRLRPRLSVHAINQIAAVVSDRRARGETGGYVPLGHESITCLKDAKAVAIQRGFEDAVLPGLAAARQQRNERWRYAAFW